MPLFWGYECIFGAPHLFAILLIDTHNIWRYWIWSKSLAVQKTHLEADVVEVTVMEVVREERSVDVLVLVNFRLTFCFMAGIQKSTVIGNITCTGSKSPFSIILNIVYNLKLSFLNNIFYYIYIYFLYLINNVCVILYVGHRGWIIRLHNSLLELINTYVIIWTPCLSSPHYTSHGSHPLLNTYLKVITQFTKSYLVSKLTKLYYVPYTYIYCLYASSHKRQ